MMRVNQGLVMMPCARAYVSVKWSRGWCRRIKISFLASLAVSNHLSQICSPSSPSARLFVYFL
jgi:hypothetical protein